VPFYPTSKKGRHTEPFHSLMESWIISPYRLASLLRDISPHLHLHVRTCVREPRSTQSILGIGRSTINTNCRRGSVYSIVAFVIVRLFGNRSSFIEGITTSVQTRSRSDVFKAKHQRDSLHHVGLRCITRSPRYESMGHDHVAVNF